MVMKKDDSHEQTSVRMPLSEILKKTVCNKNFRSIIVVTVLWNMARYFTAGFMGIFKYKDLMMSVLLVQIINIGANLFRMLISKPIGIYSDKHSYAKGFKFGVLLASAGFFINIFTTRSTWFLIVPYTILLTSSNGTAEHCDDEWMNEPGTPFGGCALDFRRVRENDYFKRVVFRDVFAREGAEICMTCDKIKPDIRN